MSARDLGENHNLGMVGFLDFSDAFKMEVFLNV